MAELEKTPEVKPLTPEQVQANDAAMEAQVEEVFHKIRLLQTVIVQDWQITRVPGGWIMAKPMLTGTDRLAPGRSVAAIHLIQVYVPEPMIEKTDGAAKGWKIQMPLTRER